MRERVVAQLANVDEALAAQVAAGLGIDVPAPLPVALAREIEPEVDVSPALSLRAHPGDGSIRTRRVAILISDGMEGESARSMHAGLADAGAVPRFVAARLGAVQPEDGEAIEAEATLETAPAVLFDAMILPGGARANQAFEKDGHALDFVKAQYRHGKPILAFGDADRLLDCAGIRRASPENADPGVLVFDVSDTPRALTAFTEAIAHHRYYERESDPPLA